MSIIEKLAQARNVIEQIAIAANADREPGVTLNSFLAWLRSLVNPALREIEQSTPAVEGGRMNPEAALRALAQFLLGEAPLDGIWFGDEVTNRGRYWWRKNAREVIDAILRQIEAAPSPPDSSRGEPVPAAKPNFIYPYYTALVEPQARYWRQAIDEWSHGTYDTLSDEVEQRARSIAQAEQAAN